MQRRSLFLTAAAVLLSWGMIAPTANAGSVPLSTLLGTTTSFDGLDFTFSTYVPTGGAPSAANVDVTFGVFNGEIGFTLNGSFGALAGLTQDADLVYSVSSAAPISDAVLFGNPASIGTGFGSVSESIYSGSSIGGPTIGSLYIQNPTLYASTTLTPPSYMITIDKDIEAIGGSNGVSFSSVTQAFSVTGVPEPTSMALLGIGMTGFLAFRRLFKRTSVA
jgi:hypothetical protein